jgi:hypothetical protein
VHDAPEVLEIEGLRQCWSPRVLEEVALLDIQDVAGQKRDAPPQLGMPAFELGEEAVPVQNSRSR